MPRPAAGTTACRTRVVAFTMVVRVVELKGLVVMSAFEGESHSVALGDSLVLEELTGVSKGEWRSALRARRRSRLKHDTDLRGASGALSVEEGLYEQWLNACVFFGLPVGQVIPALFVPTPSEPPVWQIIRSVERCLLPVLVGEDGPLPEPQWGTSTRGADLVRMSVKGPGQPRQVFHDEAEHTRALADVDIVLVPALAVDGDGVRLGQGGGWYDRALAEFAQGVPVVAVVFDDEVLPGGMLPLEPHDRCVDAVVTPSRFIAF